MKTALWASLNDEQNREFLTQALKRAGAEELVTPREIIRDYLTLLDILKDNPNATFREILSSRAGGGGADTGDANAGPSAHISGVTLSDLDF